MNNQTIDYIESVRSSNNMLWMGILKIALKYYFRGYRPDYR